MRANVRPCLGYGNNIEMCQCKTMSGTWHRHGYVRASVRPCLGHGIGLGDDSQ
ncbi:Urocanate hydratase [Gossypium arboreum]|uniref:Urocanate hydratase n=1 Tax=Gossypium arboreum TaxID=29729 RepID=A0A0B0N7A8_GOSAR|nr:Urocanate hydratase [Gossypium arboreum]